MAARRRTRKPARRRSPKPMLNVLNTAQTVVVANAATRAFFGVDLATFALDGWARPVTGNVNAPAGATNYATGLYRGGSNNSWELSAAELVKGMIPGGEGFGQGPGWTVGKAVMFNLKNNPQAIAAMVLTPVAFKVGKKVLAKPLINPANRLLKAAGAGSILKI